MSNEPLLPFTLPQSKTNSWSLWGFPSSPTYLFLHATAWWLRRTSTSSPKRMLLCCLRRTLKPSASAIVISKLYQRFRVRDHPYGLQDSLPTLNPSCSLQNIMHLRHGSKARYGWVANPYRKSLLTPFPTGTFTLQDTPSFPRRDNVQKVGVFRPYFALFDPKMGDIRNVPHRQLIE